ncbi:MAG TPA: FG-GAP-like repeat-containing protein [Niabella sp.]
MRQIIIDNTPDLFGLQEFSNNPFRNWFVAQMDSIGYNVHWVVSPVTSGSPKVIFYKKDRFSLNTGGAFPLGSDQRSAEWGIFTDQLNNQKYFVCNSHWGLTASGRLLHSQTLADSVRFYNSQHYPAILFGDFNAQPVTPEIASIKSALDLTDALGDDLGGPTFHGWTSTGSSKIDWIMSTRAFAYTAPKVIQTSYSGNWPSDHWPVMTTFVPAIFGEPNSDVHGTSENTGTRFYFADINGDNKADKIYWNPTFESGQPRVFLSNGDGSFTYAASHSSSASASSATRYYFADVNGDNKADLVTWNPSLNAGHTRIYLSTTGGNFSTSVIDNPGGISASTATTFYFADLNGDSKADKIYWNPGNFSGQTIVYLATGGGDFSTAVSSGSAGSSTTTGTNFYFADINGDGKADKIMWHPSLNGGKTMVYLSNGDGTFTLSSTLSNSGASGFAGTTQFYFADINGDGKADKIYWNPANFSGIVKVYFSTGTAFGGPYYSLRGPSESTATLFYFADISGDGQADQIRWNPSLDAGALRNYLAR